VTVWLVVRWTAYESDEVVGVFASEEAALKEFPASKAADAPITQRDRRVTGWYHYEEQVKP
jgi:hypothetical protein